MIKNFPSKAVLSVYQRSTMLVSHLPENPANEYDAQRGARNQNQEIPCDGHTYIRIRPRCLQVVGTVMPSGPVRDLRPVSSFPLFAITVRHGRILEAPRGNAIPSRGYSRSRLLTLRPRAAGRFCYPAYHDGSVRYTYS